MLNALPHSMNGGAIDWGHKNAYEELFRGFYVKNSKQKIYKEFIDLRKIICLRKCVSLTFQN